MDKEHKPNREITYHVGWKKGTIRLENNEGEAGRKTLPPAAPSEAVHLWLQRYLFRAAPAASGRLLACIVLAAPAISFVASLALVYLLIRAA